MIPYRIIFLIFFSSINHLAFSITWDEPWQEEIFQKSDYFILGRVTDAKPGAVRIRVVRQFGDKKTEDEIILQGFHMLRICSSSDSDKVTFYFQMIDSVYLFLKKTEIGYCLPTPTSGYAIVTNGKVLSTFRHSYHQAHLSMPVYEQCMRYIWASYKKINRDENAMRIFIEKNLQQLPAGFSGNEIALFFLQHAALEVLYHTRDVNNFKLILPFVNCSNNHLVISAVRCLGNFNNEESRKLLIDLIKDGSRDNFVKSLAVESLKKLNPVQEKVMLNGLIKIASDSEIGFGGNIMDPRVCTTLPSVKQALKELVSGLHD